MPVDLSYWAATSVVASDESISKDWRVILAETPVPAASAVAVPWLKHRGVGVAGRWC